MVSGLQSFADDFGNEKARIKAQHLYVALSYRDSDLYSWCGGQIQYKSMS